MKQLSINNILIIEDDPNDVELIKEYLKAASFKYKIFHSASLVGGIELIEEKTINLVLLDLSLDDTSGFNTLTDYLEKVEDVPVIVLTGNKNEAVGIRSVSAGAQDFLVKGEFDEQRLINAIKYSIQRFKSQAKLKENNKILVIREKRYREAQKIGRYTNWEMNIVNNEMKWSDEMFQIFGFPPGSFSPTLSDFLRYVHIEDRESVESFFENAIKTGELTKINHRILVQGRQVKMLNIRAQVKYDETTNSIILFGNLQDVTDNTSSLKDRKPTAPVKKTPEINLEYSAALPKDFDFFEHVLIVSNFLLELMNSGLDSQQMDIISKLAVSMGNYTKMTVNFQNLVPMLEQRNHPKETEFDLDLLMQEIAEPFKLQKRLGRTPVNVMYEKDFTGHFFGAKQDIRLTVFNIILNIIEVNEKKATINLYVKKVVQEQLFLEFRYEFNAHLPIVATLMELIKTEHIFEIDNLKNLFSKYPLDVVVSAYMIQNLKGEISYVTNDHNQSTFTLLVPVKAIEKKVIDGKIIAPVHLLLAEDHVMNKIVLKNTIKAWSDKIKLKEVNTGAEVLKEIKRNPYDLILVNVELPDSSGIDLVKKIKGKLNIPVLGISSYPSSKEKQLCLEAGMDAYLQKPYNNQTLFDKILQVLEK